MGDEIPVVVRMWVQCTRCGHAEDDTYEFDMPIAMAQPRQEFVPGKCPDCSAPLQIHLRGRSKCSRHDCAIPGLLQEIERTITRQGRQNKALMWLAPRKRRH